VKVRLYIAVAILLLMSTCGVSPTIPTSVPTTIEGIVNTYGNAMAVSLGTTYTFTPDADFTDGEVEITGEGCGTAVNNGSTIDITTDGNWPSGDCNWGFKYNDEYLPISVTDPVLNVGVEMDVSVTKAATLEGPTLTLQDTKESNVTADNFGFEAGLTISSANSPSITFLGDNNYVGCYTSLNSRGTPDKIMYFVTDGTNLIAEPTLVADITTEDADCFIAITRPLPESVTSSSNIVTPSINTSNTALFIGINGEGGDSAYNAVGYYYALGELITGMSLLSSGSITPVKFTFGNRGFYYKKGFEDIYVDLNGNVFISYRLESDTDIGVVEVYNPSGALIRSTGYIVITNAPDGQSQDLIQIAYNETSSILNVVHLGTATGKEDIIDIFNSIYSFSDSRFVLDESVQITDQEAGNAREPKAAMDNDGNVVIAGSNQHTRDAFLFRMNQETHEITELGQINAAEPESGEYVVPIDPTISYLNNVNMYFKNDNVAYFRMYDAGRGAFSDEISTYDATYITGGTSWVDGKAVFGIRNAGSTQFTIVYSALSPAGN